MREFINKGEARRFIVVALLLCNLLVAGHAVAHAPESFGNCAICHFQGADHGLLSLAGSNSPSKAPSSVPNFPVASGFTCVVDTSTPIRAPPF